MQNKTQTYSYVNTKINTAHCTYTMKISYIIIQIPTIKDLIQILRGHISR